MGILLSKPQPKDNEENEKPVTFKESKAGTMMVEIPLDLKDPRSPSENIPRTPTEHNYSPNTTISLADSYLNHGPRRSGINEINELQLLETDIDQWMRDGDLCAEKADSCEVFPKTPLMDTPKSHLPRKLVNKHVMLLSDPRSPTIGIDRTPIILKSKINDDTESFNLTSLSEANNITLDLDLPQSSADAYHCAVAMRQNDLTQFLNETNANVLHEKIDKIKLEHDLQRIITELKPPAVQIVSDSDFDDNDNENQCDNDDTYASSVRTPIQVSRKIDVGTNILSNISSKKLSGNDMVRTPLGELRDRRSNGNSNENTAKKMHLGKYKVSKIPVFKKTPKGASGNDDNGTLWDPKDNTVVI